MFCRPVYNLTPSDPINSITGRRRISEDARAVPVENVFALGALGRSCVSYTLARGLLSLDINYDIPCMI